MDERDLIRERIPIVDFINEWVPLKKAGRNYKGICPFHNEKTASFIVSPERNIWHCFGCGKGGDVFSFAMEFERIEFTEALKFLADRAGVKLSFRVARGSKDELRERLLEMHHLTSEFYTYLLTKHRVGERARQYLKERGVSDQIIATFKLGYAPQGWDNLLSFLRKKGFSDKELKASGLFIEGRSGMYDRFRGRIIFPIHDPRGTVIAFSGRLIEVVSGREEAKYINSPETPLYIKGDTLYGLSITKERIKKEGSVVVVEGEFDTLSSFQAGVANVVAIKGSALTEMQVKILKRFTERLILALDRDAAGDRAARRGIEIADGEGFDIRIATIEHGKDPDEAARENPEEWKKAVKNARPFYDFVIASACARFDVSDPFGKKKVSDEVLPILSKINNSIIQAHYIKVLAETLGVPEDRLHEAIRKVKPVEYNRSLAQVDTPVTKSHDELLEEHVLSVLLKHPNFSHGLTVFTEALDPSDFMSPVVKRIFIQLIDYFSQHNEFKVNDFAKTLPSELLPTFDTVYLSEVIAETDPQQTDQELRRLILEVKRAILKRKIKKTTTDIHIAEIEQNEERLRELNSELRELTAGLTRLT
ncbi:DNA primase [Candidatus Gottesmanbacteria bacterium]|nr:DNA primase [Candidatus Gottesmanbacteria bacterium]